MNRMGRIATHNTPFPKGTDVSLSDYDHEAGTWRASVPLKAMGEAHARVSYCDVEAEPRDGFLKVDNVIRGIFPHLGDRK